MQTFRLLIGHGSHQPYQQTPLGFKIVDHIILLFLCSVIPRASAGLVVVSLKPDVMVPACPSLYISLLDFRIHFVAFCAVNQGQFWRHIKFKALETLHTFAPQALRFWPTGLVLSPPLTNYSMYVAACTESSTNSTRGIHHQSRCHSHRHCSRHDLKRINLQVLHKQTVELSQVDQTPAWRRGLDKGTRRGLWPSTRSTWSHHAA